VERERVVAEEMKRHVRWLIVALILIVGALALVELVPRGEAVRGPVVTFRGAARRVGGSCLVVENEGARFIVDCGALGEEGEGALPPRPDSIDFAVITHAHIDHVGLLVELFAAGFKGPVYCTPGTAELAPIMLSMMRGLARAKIPRETYDRALASLVPVPFGRAVVERGASFRFFRAGHLLGAASVEMLLPSGADTVRLVVSGDIGAGNSVLLPPAEKPDRADYVVMESTYGGILRDSSGALAAAGHEAFAESIAGALRAGGDVLIPSFTLGRTQEAMAVIDISIRNGTIPPGTEVYVDSPTARKITDVYRRLKGELSEWAQSAYPGDALRFPELREVRSRTSLKVHGRSHRPAVFISSSGDLAHANAPRHLMRMYDDSRNLLCIIGWQPPLSVGARLAAGESPVLVGHQEGKKSERDWVSPKIVTRVFHSFSGHADQAGLIEWLAAAAGVRRVFLVHGEENQALALASAIRARLGLEVTVPRRGDAFVLTARGDATAKRSAAPAGSRALPPAPAPGRADSTMPGPVVPAGEGYEGAD
jgi:metallo-beta-lactamase family protein